MSGDRRNLRVGGQLVGHRGALLGGALGVLDDQLDRKSLDIRVCLNSQFRAAGDVDAKGGIVTRHGPDIGDLDCVARLQLDTTPLVRAPGFGSRGGLFGGLGRCRGWLLRLFSRLRCWLGAAASSQHQA